MTSHDTRRHANRCRCPGQVMNNSCASANHCPGADGAAWNDTCPDSEKGPFLHNHAAPQCAARCDMGIVADQAVVINARASVYNYMRTYNNIWLDYSTGKYYCAGPKSNTGMHDGTGMHGRFPGESRQRRSNIPPYWIRTDRDDRAPIFLCQFGWVGRDPEDWHAEKRVPLAVIIVVEDAPGLNTGRKEGRDDDLAVAASADNPHPLAAILAFIAHRETVPSWRALLG